jgi:hypothetical protein
MASRIDRELLTQRQLAGPILATSGERQDATEEQEHESRSHRALDSAQVAEREGRLNLFGLRV